MIRIVTRPRQAYVKHIYFTPAGQTSGSDRTGLGGSIEEQKLINETFTDSIFDLLTLLRTWGDQAEMFKEARPPSLHIEGPF